MLSARMIMILGLGGAGMTSSLTTSARLELADRTFFLFVRYSAPMLSSNDWFAPYPFRSWGMGERPVLPESRLQMAMDIIKKIAIASLYNN